MYCAIIGDIVNSRKLENRAEVQLKLKQLLDQINIKYSEDIAAKFIITIGDEFQGLLKTPKRIFNLLDSIKMEIFPITIRFGIGLGDMNTRIYEDMAIGSDGPAYYAAREAIDEIKKSNYRYEQPTRDILIRYSQNNINFKRRLELMNSTLSTCYFIERRWSEKQREIIKVLTIEDKEMNQKELGNLFDLSQSSIQRRINSSGFYTYKYAKNNVASALNDIWEELHDK